MRLVRSHDERTILVHELDVHVTVQLGLVAILLFLESQHSKALSGLAQSQAKLWVVLHLASPVFGSRKSSSVLLLPLEVDRLAVPAVVLSVVRTDVGLLELNQVVLELHPELAIIPCVVFREASDAPHTTGPLVRVVRPGAGPLASTPRIPQFYKPVLVCFHQFEHGVSVALHDASLRLGSITLRMGWTASSESRALLLSSNKPLPNRVGIVVFVVVNCLRDTIGQLRKSNVHQTTFDDLVRAVLLGISFLKELGPEFSKGLVTRRAE